MTTSLEASARRDSPPAVDLFGHFRDLSRVALPALLIGLLVGLAVFGLRALLVPKEYSATVVAEVSSASNAVIPGDAFVEQLRAPFTALSTDQNVLRQVLTQVDTGWDIDELRAQVTTGPGTSPSLMVFTATADSPEQAENVARAMVTAISEASISNHARDISRQVDQLRAQITAERARNRTLPDRGDAKAESNATLADLNSQLTRLQNSSSDTLSILAAPSGSETPVTPKPVQEGAVAGLAATIVAAEILVLVRGRLGRRPNAIWARRVAHKYGAHLTYGKPGEATLPATLLPALAQRHRRAQVALVLSGDGVHVDGLLDGLNGSRSETADRPMRIEHLALTDPWWQRIDAADLALSVVFVSTAGTDRTDAQQVLSQLAEIGGVRHLVVQRPYSRRRHLLAGLAPRGPRTPPGSGPPSGPFGPSGPGYPPPSWQPVGNGRTNHHAR